MSCKDIIEIRKEPRGLLDYRYDSENRVLAVRWNDNYVIILATNCQAINPNAPLLSSVDSNTSQTAPAPVSDPLQQSCETQQ